MGKEEGGEGEGSKQILLKLQFENETLRNYNSTLLAELERRRKGKAK